MRKRAVLAAIAAVVLLLVVFGVVLSRRRVARHRVFRTAPAEQRPAPPTAEVRPIEQWTEQFRGLEAGGRWNDLDALLDRIAQEHAAEYARWSLAYLHARARLERGDEKGAAEKLAPFLAAGNRFRDLALYHQSEIADASSDGDTASKLRTELIFSTNDQIYRAEAMDDEVEWRATREEVKPLLTFAMAIYNSADTARRRDVDARIVEALLRTGDREGALARGLSLLRAGTTDDASDRVSRALDRPELLARMNAGQWAMLGESFQNHRHFDRAVALLTMAVNASGAKQAAAAAAPEEAAMLMVAKPKAHAPKKAPAKGSAKPSPKGKPPAKAAAKPAAAAPAGVASHDELLFGIGRSWFGDEKYAEAQQAYLRGAGQTRDPRWKATFLFHASRAAQLQGNDAVAEQLMSQTLAVPGKWPATSAALTQRLRTRLKAKRYAEAMADLNAIRAGFPREHAVVEASVAYATGMVAAGNNGAAVVTLNAIPRALLDKYDPSEIGYWRARALEASNPPAAFAAYLDVLRAKVPTHFAYFARQRLDAPAMKPKLAQELALRDGQVKQLVAAKQFDAARRVATDRILLAPTSQATKELADIYRQLPPYRALLELTPAPLPAFPNIDVNDRASLLMAMGLYDEAVDVIPQRWGLRPLRNALTQSVALNRGNASRLSIYAIEVAMSSVPGDYLPELLPESVRELLYPRYFLDFIDADSKKFNADPTLVLSIMREESRFNPRAKSEAAARGLLQFIITTARDIGRDVGLVKVEPEDLYDPRVIIRLGAKYISELTQRFGGDHYMAASAYNAGPNQTALWSRLAPAPGDDYFLSSINFDETKHYVRKVMNSYRRYSEIYGNAGPQGGLRAEP